MGTAPLEHVAQQGLLPVVGGEHGDLVGGVAQQSHVLEDRHEVLGLAQVLCVWGGDGGDEGRRGVKREAGATGGVAREDGGWGMVPRCQATHPWKAAMKKKHDPSRAPREAGPCQHPPPAMRAAAAHLVEVRQGAGLAAAAVVGHVDELAVEGKAGVGGHKGRGGGDGGQVAQVAVPPVVQLGQGGARAALRQKEG